jgi:glycosyltransferase involved in cell wall biosynthesis
MTPVLSVIICTLNNAGYLRKALASLIAQTLPNVAYEVLVVDNGSMDSTRETVQTCRDMENLRYIYDPFQGLSHARNVGWQNARGKYIVYLDDDAVASPNWLERISHRYETLLPQPASVGGKVVPIWEAERPPWLTPELERHLSVVDWMGSPRFIDEDRYYLAGTNVSYQRTVLEESGGFHTDLGRRGTLLLSNEELSMQYLLRSRGHLIWYDPEIVVHHHIKAERLNRPWFYKRFYWQGVSDAILEAQVARWNGTPKSGLTGMSRDLSQTARDSIRYLKILMSGSEDVVSRCRINQRLGRILSNLQIASGRLKISDGPARQGSPSRSSRQSE